MVWDQCPAQCIRLLLLYLRSSVGPMVWPTRLFGRYASGDFCFFCALGILPRISSEPMLLRLLQRKLPLFSELGARHFGVAVQFHRGTQFGECSERPETAPSRRPLYGPLGFPRATWVERARSLPPDSDFRRADVANFFCSGDRGALGRRTFLSRTGGDVHSCTPRQNSRRFVFSFDCSHF